MRTGHAVNQGGTAGGISRIYIFFSNAELVLDRNYFSFCQGLFFIYFYQRTKTGEPVVLAALLLEKFYGKNR